MSETEKFIYGSGFRDALAWMLAANKDKTKLKEAAELYKTKFGEHFALNYHLS